MFDPVNHSIRKEMNCTFVASPQFLVDPLKEKCGSGHAPFYRRMRKQLNILMVNGKPVGGRWSFDEDNREAPNYSGSPESPPTVHVDSRVFAEAIAYVKNHFANNPGDLSATANSFPYPLTHLQAKMRLQWFMRNALSRFGKYQDAIDQNSDFVFHSALSPAMNIGLLLDREVVDAIRKSNKHIASLEGFTRQVIGWRQYVYCLYMQNPKMKKCNYLNHSRKIKTDIWWTGIGNIFVDSVLEKIRRLAYAHHIERLMILGNWFLLTGKHPAEVYRMFMCWTIDAYEWVMVPNVFGMSQFADGGKMMHRPYISSSKYLLKMSNFKADKKDCEAWDSLYYYFISSHGKLSNNYFLKPAFLAWKKKSKGEQKRILALAQTYLKQ
jgi:deoxyribodipyrimidine photolyase-related protein